ncbi:MAG: hypothetical protein K0T99_00300 [Alphaproteobacteria bacterium]|nr:hypothetical protein [Alphaproteobacteria bacterium]
MLGISFSEFIIVAIVACIVIRPKDVPTVIKFFKVLYKKFMRLKKEFFSYYQEFHDEVLEDESEYIVDQQGVPQKVYDISDLKDKSISSRIKDKPKEKVSERI